MQKNEALIHAVLLDGLGGGRHLTWPEVRAWTPDMGFLWTHFQMDLDEAKEWVEKESGLDPIVAETLMDEDNHPRIVCEGESLFGTLRGINFIRSEKPEEMVVINLYLDANRAITTRTTQVMTTREIASNLAAGTGPRRPGEFLLALLDRLHDRMEPTLEEIADELDNYEEHLSTQQGPEEDIREKLVNLRHGIIQLRRFLSPQKSAMILLGRSLPPWMNKKQAREIREIEDRLQRFLGDLESYRERVVVIREEVSNLLSERMNRAMYMLSIVTGIFLPLGFLTGLFGINIGGMPGVENPLAFWLFCAFLLVVTGTSLILFKRKRWI